MTSPHRLLLMVAVVGLSLVLATPPGQASPAPRPTEGFVAGDIEPVYDREREYDLRHTVLDLHVDWEARALEGTATHRLAPLRDMLTEIRFDQYGLEFKEVLLNGSPVKWIEEKEALIVLAPGPLVRGEEVEVAVTYRSENPVEGAYWNLPDKHYPKRPRQLWTQGQQDENRFWFPTYEFPNDRLTSEQIITVGSRYTVIGNGELVEQRDNGDGTTTWHYRMTTPHTTYLQSLVIGEYQVLEDAWDGIPIRSYVRPDLFDRASRSFSETARMMEVLSRMTGVRYPYPVYRQSEVEDFLWGGMENITATTLTARTLRTPAAFEYSTSQGLVAHELAHQWFGDLVTTKNWADIWLNEGFAEYFETVYWEFGVDSLRAQWERYEDLRGYLREDRTYRRPLVTRYFKDTNDLFDGVAYEKGSCLVHMLRSELGEARFWEFIRTYLERHRDQVVETADLRQVAAEVSGRPLDRFFDQWVHMGGHPEFEVSWGYESGSRLVHLEVKQVQKVDVLTPLFHTRVAVDLTGEDWTRRFTVTCDAPEQEFYFQVPSRPRLHEFDRDEAVIKTLKDDKDTAELEYQLMHSPSLISRCRAAAALGKSGDAGSVKRLQEVLSDAGQFWGLRGEAALALGRLELPESREALLVALSVDPAPVRYKVVEALGHFDEPQVLRALGEVAARDPVPQVAERALSSVARTQGEGAGVILRSGLKRTEWRETIRRGAIRGFRALKDPDWISTLVPFTEPGVYVETREDAIGAIGVLGAHLEEDSQRRPVRRRLEKLLDDPLFQVRNAAVRALGSLGDSEAVPLLEKKVRGEEHRWIQASARRAIKDIRTGAGKEAALGEMQQDLDELRRENDKIKKDIHRLRERLDAEDQAREDKPTQELPIEDASPKEN